EVRQLGVTTVKSLPNFIMVVHLVSPDNRYNIVYLRNYGLLQVKDVIGRIPGVGQVQIFGGGDYSMRVWLDPCKVAARELAAGDYALRSMLDNKDAVGIGIFQAPGSNALQLSSTVRKTMEELKKNFPEGLEYRIVYDPTINVRDGIREVVKTLFEAIMLV